MPVTNAASGIKPGTVTYFAASAAPAGWLKANGAAVSRAIYAGLFAAIGTTYGVGDGATTFNLPDLRGEFVRGLDEGRGADGGRVMGSYQADALQNITGTIAFHGAGIGTVLNGFNGAFTASALQANQYHTNSATAGANSWGQADFNAANVARVDAETRPRNIAMLACIKY